MSLRWSLVDHAAIAGLFAPIPQIRMSFLALSEVLEAVLDLDRVGAEPREVRSAVTRRVLDEQGPNAEWGSVPLPDPSPGVDAWEAVLSWVDGLAGSTA